MNERLLFTFNLIISVLVALTFFSIETILSRKMIESTRLNIETRLRVQFQEITNVAKNDLLQGNYRYARNTISKGIDSTEVGFKVSAVDGTIDKSSSFERISESERPFEIEIPVLFKPGGETWGTLKFVGSSREIEQFEWQLNRRLSLHSFLVGLLIFTSLALLMLVFWRTSNEIASAIECILSNSAYNSESLSGKLWEPTLMRVTDLANRFVTTRESLMRAEQKAAVSDIALQVSHDIRSPLSFLSILAKSQKTVGSDERRLILESVERLQAIANDLLTHSRRLREESSPQVSKKHFATGLLIADLKSTISIISSALDKKAIDIDLECKAVDQTLLVEADQVGLQRVVVNILNNSIEAIAEKGHIRLWVETKDGRIRIEISDNGQGIPVEIHDRIFEEGYSYDKSDGNGLGLYSAKKVIESWNGTIQFESRPLEGTKIIIELGTLGIAG